MNLHFSSVELRDEVCLTKTIMVGGHPNAEALRANKFVQDCVKRFRTPVCLCVQYFTYPAPEFECTFGEYSIQMPTADIDADAHHLAMMVAYDNLIDYLSDSDGCGIGYFVDRDDVEHGGYFEFDWEETK